MTVQPPMRITVTSIPGGNCHVACDWLSQPKGTFTPEQALYLARCLLERFSNLAPDVIAGIRVDERKVR
jgi:hypothetical protein